MKILLATSVAEKDLLRLATLRFSLETFWPNQDHFLFVENEATLFSCLHYKNCTVIDQEQIIPSTNIYCRWQYQQLLKLAVTLSAKDYDYVLWLDCDQLLIRPISSPYDLLKDNLAPVPWAAPWAPDWMAAAALVLGVKHISFQPGVIACMLSPVIAQNFASFLEKKYKLPWFVYLQNLSNERILWTEYLLYYTYAKLSKCYSQYHTNGTNVVPGFNLSSYHIDTLDFKALWQKHPGYFAVFESNTGIEPALTHSIFNEWLLSSLWEKEVLVCN